MSPGAWCIVGVLALLVVLLLITVVRLSTAGEFQTARIRMLEAERRENIAIANAPRKIELTPAAAKALADLIARQLGHHGRN